MNLSCETVRIYSNSFIYLFIYLFIEVTFLFSLQTATHVLLGILFKFYLKGFSPFPVTCPDGCVLLV